MAVQGFAHYNFRLARPLMEEVKAFYEKVVGLETGPRPPFPSFGYWLYAGGKDVLHLSEARPEDPRRIGSDLTFDHVALACTDWRAHAQVLRTAGIPFREEFVPATSRRQLFFRDPAGNGVELIFPAEEA